MSNELLTIISCSALEVVIIWFFTHRTRNILRKSLSDVYVNQRIMMANQSFLEGNQESLKLKMNKKVDERVVELMNMVNSKTNGDKEFANILEALSESPTLPLIEPTKILEIDPSTCVLAVDENGNIVYSSLSANILFKYDTLVGKPLDALIPQKHKDAHKTHVSQFFSSDKIRYMKALSLDLKGVTSDGKEIPLVIFLDRGTYNNKIVITAIISRR